MHSTQSSNHAKNFAYASTAAVVAVLLSLAVRSSYLLFHGLAEMFSVSVAFGVFIVAWHSRKIAANTFLPVLGIAYLQVGVFHLLHLFAYKGMGMFPEHDANLPTQLWIAARYVESIALLIAPLLAKRKIDGKKLLAVFSAVSVFIIASIFTGLFPDAFIEGVGLTPFKVISEYVVSGLMAGALILIYRNRMYFGSGIVKMVSWAILLSIMAELLFTLYVDVYGLTNLAGHYLKIVSVFLLYRAIIVNGLEKPYDTLFVDLKRHERERERFIARVQQLSAEAYERAAELESTFGSLTDPVLHINTQGRIVRANKSAHSFLGHSPVDLRYGDLLSRLKNKDTILSESIRRSLTQKASHTRDAQLNNADGERRQVSFSISPILSRESVLGAVITWHDVTERTQLAAQLQRAHDELEKRVEQRTDQLHRSLQRLQQEVQEREKAESGLSKRQDALESVYDMATAFNTNISTIIDQVAAGIARAFEVGFVSVFRFENDAVCAVSQIHDGKPMQAGKVYKHTDSCTRIHNFRKTIQLAGNLREKFPEVPCMADNGFRTYVGVPALSHTGEPIGFICIMDESERTFTEFELHLLEIFVRYFSHELERGLMENELHKGERMKMLGQLTSGVAHEVRNPLNAIQAITQALFEELESSDDIDMYRTHIANQVERLTKLMQDLLDFGKPVDRANMETVSLSKLCENTVSLWNNSHGTGERHAQYISGENGSDVFVSADPLKLQQVLINLLDNAHQHSPKDQPIILELYKKKNTDLRIRICDRGSGIKPELLNKLFEPFFTTRKQGTGLGLGIVKHIVETHGGHIEVWNNTDGPGSTFEIRLAESSETPKDFQLDTQS